MGNEHPAITAAGLSEANELLAQLPANLWPGSEKFKVVQGLLDRNNTLINEINHNHYGRYPDGLEKNADLIKELSGNIASVISLYEEVNSGFLSLVGGTAATTEAA